MTLTIAIALALALLGFGAVSAILYLWYRTITAHLGFSISMTGFMDKSRITNHQKLLSKVDSLLERGDIPNAVSALRQSLLLTHLKSGPGVIDQSVHLNLSVLSRVLSIAERSGAHLQNLAVVEDLVQSRGELQHAYLEAVRDRATFRTRRSSAGKNAPDWALSEFTRKVKELEDRIDTNKRSLQTQLDELLRELLKPAGPTVTYH